MATYQQSQKTNGSTYADEEVNVQSTPNQFRLNVDIRTTRPEPISQGYGKSIYEVEWINRDGPPIILLQIDGARAKRDASFYVELSCHPHIIRTYGLVHSNPASTMLLQERPPQGNLSELLYTNEFKPSESVLWEIFEQICDAMVFLTNRNIAHGDLACRNVLVFQMNPINPKKNLVKLTDFGITSVSQLYSLVESPGLTSMTIIPTRYAAPELLQNLKKLDYSEASDVYSMGALMWEACAYGKLPYSNINDSETIRQQKLKNKKLSQPSVCSKQLWNIINQCWEFEPNKRPNFRTLKDSISRLQSQSNEKPQKTIAPNVIRDPTVIPLELNRNDYLRNYEETTEQDIKTEVSERRDDRFYSDVESNDSHQATTDPQGYTTCPFCQERQSSPMALHDHLVRCGTKTDQCPQCHQFIQRAFFAYHYENNCADINEIEGSRKENNSHSPRPSSSPNEPPRVFNKGSQIPCEFCQKNYPGDQIDSHQKTCPKNPNRTRSTMKPPGKNSAGLSNDTVDNEPLPLNGTTWSSTENLTQRAADQHNNQDANDLNCCCCS